VCGRGIGSGYGRGSVPDGLRLLSGLLFPRSLWPEGEPAGRRYRLFFCLIALLFEGLQWFERIPETFDVRGLAAMALAVFVEGVFYTCFIWRNDNET
jgi:hypothetical protein